MDQLENALSFLIAETGVRLTDEQRDVVRHFNDSMCVAASPGTGKTTTTVCGLIAAQTIHGFKGSTINAMSFTKLATAELATRYKNMAARCGINANISFNTFHSICYKIIRDRFPEFRVREIKLAEELNEFAVFLKEEGVKYADKMQFVKKCYNAMTSLNNEMLWHKMSVENNAVFAEIEPYITLRQFQVCRARWFRRNFMLRSMLQGDIPTMALYILLLYPEIQEKYRKQFQLMVVDEFQDMSLLYLEVLKLISNKLIVVGDLKQQIYAFNGANLKIFDFFKEMYPDSLVLPLSQSFRCCDEIVELANKVIAPNEIIGTDDFKGVGPGGSVTITKGNYKELTSVYESIKTRQDNKEFNDIMFLTRNNASIIPVIEELYQRGIMFRTTKLQKVQDTEIYKDLCMLAEIAIHSTDPQYVQRVAYFMPEFKWLKARENPLLQVMAQSPYERDKSLLTMNYSYKENSSYEIINCLKRFKELNDKGLCFYEAMQPLLVIYEKYIIQGKYYLLEQTPEYYHLLVEYIVKTKTFDKMIMEEDDKAARNEHYNALHEGVRCYTFHSAKGLEAQEVYLLDVDAAIIPQVKKMERLKELGCLYDAAKELRNERNLLYVAITRAKKKLYLAYSFELSPLIASPESNELSYLDAEYKKYTSTGNEVGAFKALLNFK